MDRIEIIIIAVIVVTVIFRLRHTFRRSTMNRSRESDIQRKLEQLRKKRDEQ
ncbi:hypothetical protein ACFFK0_18300 [Paenibacillus chartarius]|uniref:DUF4083 domain-containing protein n=1 Tax=Paenibacillus chartarius TaxID=747481 RepID=A0ABV6DP23_9BACL